MVLDAFVENVDDGGMDWYREAGQWMVAGDPQSYTGKLVRWDRGDERNSQVKAGMGHVVGAPWWVVSDGQVNVDGGVRVEIKRSIFCGLLERYQRVVLLLHGQAGSAR